MEIDPRQAREALDHVQHGRNALADRLITPVWYHPALGLLLAGLVVAYGVGSRWLVIGALLVFFAGLGVLARTYRRVTGVWVSSRQVGRASGWAVAFGAVALGCIVGAMVVRNTDVGWLVWPLAAIVWLAAVVLGRSFDDALREQLRRAR